MIKDMNAIFILSCAKPKDGGGIYKYQINALGKLEQIAYLPCDKPMYGVLDSNRLHILLRESFESGNSGYFSVDLNFENTTTIENTQGLVACHLAVDNKDNYIVNYLSGNIVKNCQITVFHKGKSINSIRQNESHTHCALLSPDKKFVVVADLGLDTVFVYDRNLNLISKAKVPDGHGVRHAVFSLDCKYLYAINELVPSISVFSHENGILQYCSTLLLPCENSKANGAAIRLSVDGTKLYCSIREENAIYIYNVKGSEPILLQKHSCGGDSPRDFDITDNLLICANEKSGVAVFNIENGYINNLIKKFNLMNALCVIIKNKR